MTNKAVEYVVVDLETTGLDPKAGVILEAAMVLLDRNLNVIDEKTSLVKSYGWEIYLANAPELVQDMHQKSGLAEELRTAVEPYDEISINQDFYYWLRGHGVGIGDAPKLPITGSSVQFDRSFLNLKWPDIESLLHPYRNTDVSTLKELCRRMNPRVFAEWTKEVGERKTVHHRAIDDCHTTIAELRFYADNFLFVELDENENPDQLTIPGV